MQGKYGIYDDDFRFQLYSMGIINLATAEVDIQVDFDSKLATNDTKRFFSECLHPVEQLQEISRAIKWMLDTQYVVPDIDDAKHDGENEERLERLIPNMPPSVKGFCQATQPMIRRNFTTGLSHKTDLCFKVRHCRRFCLATSY